MKGGGVGGGHGVAGEVVVEWEEWEEWDEWE
jgi:hypothetical protein